MAPNAVTGRLIFLMASRILAVSRDFALLMACAATSNDAYACMAWYCGWELKRLKSSASNSLDPGHLASDPNCETVNVYSAFFPAPLGVGNSATANPVPAEV